MIKAKIEKKVGIFRMVILLLSVSLVWSCSTTSHLADGELLYTGISKINYENSPSQRKKWVKRDSIGVIASIGNVDKILGDYQHKAVSTARLDSLYGNVHYSDLNKKERKLLKKTLAKEEKAFSKVMDEVEAILAYPPNNALFGSSSFRSPFQFGLAIYNKFAGSEKKFGKWIFKHFATKPIYISEVSPKMRARVATNTLHNYGYFQGQVNYQLVPQKNPKKSKIAYRIFAGPLSHLDSVAYLKFPAQADSLLQQTQRKRQLWKGTPFSVVDLAMEQTRIEHLFRENGYFYYTAPNTLFRADTLQRPGYVQLQVMPSPNRPLQVRHPWYIGHTYVAVRNKEGEVLNNLIDHKNVSFNFNGEKIPLSIPMWYRSIEHHHGELYRSSDEDYTYSKLNSLEVFSQLDMAYVPKDSTRECDTLDLYITAVMDKLYDSSFEMNAVFKSNQQVGPGISFGLAKRNAFGGGEKVAFKVFGSYEWQTGGGQGGSHSLLNSYELGTELSFNIPRFLFPHAAKRRFRFPASTTFALNADWKNRAGFFNMVTLGTTTSYEWNRYSTSKHEFTVLGLDFDKVLHATPSFDSIMTANPALSVSMRDQFIPFMAYTFTYSSAKHHRNPVWLQLSVKEAGNLVSGIYAAFGDRWTKKNKELFHNPFAQYLKLSAEYHETIRLGSSRFKLATRFFGGVIYSYGNSTRAPYADQFYVGGANSVRGFAVRTIGPGGYRAVDSKYAYVDQTGDLKLEFNAELRARLFGSLHGAIFLDAGNVWLLRHDELRPDAKITASNLKKMAVGTGLGLRYDLDFLVLRFDVGVPLHAPYETGKSGWYNIHKFGKSLAYHFAIGYPF